VIGPDGAGAEETEATGAEVVTGLAGEEDEPEAGTRGAELDEAAAVTGTTVEVEMAEVAV